MKIIFPAFLCLIFGLIPFIPNTAFDLPEEIYAWKDITIPALALFIMLTAAFSGRKKKEPDYFASLRKSEFETNEELAKRLGDKLESLESESYILVEGKETLQAKVQELLAQIKELKEGSKEDSEGKRNAQIDAELVNLLSVLQEKGRIIDFFMDDITAYPDEQVGAAARVVHNGCAKALKDYFQISPIHNASEGSDVSLDAGYDTEKYRLVGKVSGEPPFNGKLLHHGWIVEKISLPRLLKSDEELEKHRIITAAEVEIA